MANMEKSERKGKDEKDKRSICTFCNDDGLLRYAVAYCDKCVKYVCTSCLKSHAKFLPDHRLIDGEMADSNKVKLRAPLCEIHRDQTVELYCEDHGCVFCKFCRRLKHKQCCVKTVDDAMKDRNVEAEFESIFGNLTQLQEHMEKKRDENQAKFDDISKHKGEIKSTVATLRKELIEVLEKFENSLDGTENAVLENVTENIHSYSSFTEQLRSTLKSHDLERKESDCESLFFSVVKLKQIFNNYQTLMEQIENETTVSELFVVQDERLPLLIQKLTGISCEERSEDVRKYPKFTDISCQKEIKKSTEEKDCQTDAVLHDNKEETDKQACNFKKLTEPTDEKHSKVGAEYRSVEDDAELGSSELTLEHGMQNIGTKSFRSIKSCSLLKETEMVNCSSKVCMLPDGRIVYHFDRRGCLNILDKDMTTIKVLVIPPYKGDASVDFSSLDVAVLDTKRVVILISVLASVETKNYRTDENVNIIQMVTLMPNVELGREIKLKYTCKKIACFNNKIYVYSPDLPKSSCFRCAGIEILNLNGDVLKTIQLFEQLSCFCPNKDGDIVYFGTRYVNGINKHFFKCVTKEGVEVYNSSCSVQPKFATIDIEGNIMILASENIAVLKADGSQMHVLLKRESLDKNWHPTSMFYNDINNTILAAGYIEDYKNKNKLYLFQLQY